MMKNLKNFFLTVLLGFSWSGICFSEEPHATYDIDKIVPVSERLDHGAVTMRQKVYTADQVNDLLTNLVIYINARIEEEIKGGESKYKDSIALINVFDDWHVNMETNQFTIGDNQYNLLCQKYTEYIPSLDPNEKDAKKVVKKLNELIIWQDTIDEQIFLIDESQIDALTSSGRTTGGEILPEDTTDPTIIFKEANRLSSWKNSTEVKDISITNTTFSIITIK